MTETEARKLAVAALQAARQKIAFEASVARRTPASAPAYAQDCLVKYNRYTQAIAILEKDPVASKMF